MGKLSKCLVANILLFTLLLSVVASVATVSANLKVEYGPVQISTGGNDASPQIGVDSNGNVHVLWSSDDASTLMYMMFDSKGGVLIGETNLLVATTPATMHCNRPSMVIDADDDIHVIYHGFSHYDFILSSGYQTTYTLDSAEVMYLKLDPYEDDRDGDPADFYTITMIPETVISTKDEYKSRAANMDIDPYGRLHIAWFDNGTNRAAPPDWEVHYMVMNIFGGVLVPEQTVATGFTIDGDWSEAEIVADSQGNAHIYFVTAGWTGTTNAWRDIWYLMANGSDGSLLIAPTQITDSGQQWKHSQPAADTDSNDVLYFVYHDSRAEGGTKNSSMTEIYRFVVDPYLDDLSGDPADPNVIVIQQPAPLTAVDGFQSYMANIYIDASDNEHIVWTDLRDVDEGEIYYDQYPTIDQMRITNFDGTVAPTMWWEGQSSNRRAELAAVDGCTVYVTFNGEHDNGEYLDVYFMILSCAAAPVGGDLLLADKLLLLAPALVAIAASSVAVTSLLFYYRRRS